MSFATDTKNELAHIEPEKDCCKLAEIAECAELWSLRVLADLK